jgi:hypothetical protein
MCLLYLQERWQMSRSRGYELMSASEVIENLSDMSDKPANARQADALSKAPAEQQQQAWALYQSLPMPSRRSQNHIFYRLSSKHLRY